MGVKCRQGIPSYITAFWLLDKTLECFEDVKAICRTHRLVSHFSGKFPISFCWSVHFTALLKFCTNHIFLIVHTIISKKYTHYILVLAALVLLPPRRGQHHCGRVRGQQWDPVLLVQDHSGCDWQDWWVISNYSIVSVGHYSIIPLIRGCGWHQILEPSVSHRSLGHCLPHPHER